jgi:hypothetical protein
LPIKDSNNKAIRKNKIKLTSSSKNKKLAEIELGKYLTYSKSIKARASFLLDELLFAK